VDNLKVDSLEGWALYCNGLHNSDPESGLDLENKHAPINLEIPQ